MNCSSPSVSFPHIYTCKAYLKRRCNWTTQLWSLPHLASPSLIPLRHSTASWLYREANRFVCKYNILYQTLPICVQIEVKDFWRTLWELFQFPVSDLFNWEKIKNVEINFSSLFLSVLRRKNTWVKINRTSTKIQGKYSFVYTTTTKYYSLNVSDFIMLPVLVPHSLGPIGMPPEQNLFILMI